jgi:hypothetical protein
MLGIGGGSRVVDLPVETWGPFVAAVFFSLICLTAVGLQLKRWAYEDAGHTFAGRLFMVASSIALFTLSLSELASAEFNPFIYFRF